MDKILNTHETLNDKRSVRNILQELEVGASHSFPLSRLASIRSMAWVAGLELERVFKTRINKDTKELIVTRQS